MKRLIALILLIFSLQITIPGVSHAAPAGIVMNFSDVEISTMVKFISELTGRNFVLDEKVKGKVSVYSPSKLSVDEAFALFTSVLELKGFTVVQSGKINKIVPTSGAKQSSTRLVSGDQLPVGDAFLARVFPLEQISSQEALTFLQPIVSREGHIGSLGSGNMLLVVDAASNLQKIDDILKLVDTPQRREGSELVYLKFGSAEEIAKTLQEWLSGRGPRQPGTNANAVTGPVQVIADLRLNALILFGPEKDKQEIRSLISQLDVEPPEDSSKVNVVFLEHTDAVELAKVLEGVVKGMTAVADARNPRTANPIAASGLGDKLTITPDEATNALVIMATPTDYNNLYQVIKKLDRRSKQVYVEVLIAEVSLDKGRELGLQSGVLGGAALNKYLNIGGFYDPMGTLQSILSSNLPGLDLVATDRASVGAVLKALDTNGMLNILSTPNLLTTDNKEAEISVGENVPFKGSTTGVAGTSNTYESVDRKDIGISLKIKPQVSEGEYIRMDLYQEISAVKNDKGQAIDLVTTKRSAKTSVVVKDRETIVIGGLIQDTEDINEQKIPFLGDIPGLGWLFKTKTKSRTKTNLMILLTPHIIKDADDLAAVSQEQRVRFSGAAKDLGKVDAERIIMEGGGKLQNRQQVQE